MVKTKSERFVGDVGQSKFKKVTAIVGGIFRHLEVLRMIPRIKSVKPIENYILDVVFDDGKAVYYDFKDDIEAIADFQDLLCIPSLFSQVQLDESRTCIFWNDRIDLPSDAIYEFGKKKGR